MRRLFLDYATRSVTKKKKTTNKYKKFTRIYAVGDKPVLGPGVEETDWQTDRMYRRRTKYHTVRTQTNN